MRPWMIVLSSAGAAVIAAAAMIRPELSTLPHAAVLPSLMVLWPILALIALAVYALCAILLTSGDLVADALRVRLYLSGNPARVGPGLRDWMAAFAQSGYRRLVLPAIVQPHSAAINGTVVLQRPFQPHQARREVARLYYVGAARVHFFSALVVLAAGVVLGTAQTHGPLLFVPGPVPTVPAALAVAGLLLVAVLARIAVDVTAEPLIEMLAQLPVEPAETGALRRAGEMFAAAPAADPLPAVAASAMIAEIPDRLGAVLKQSHLALIEAIERLSATTDGLAQTTRSSIETFEAAFRANQRQEQPPARPTALDSAAMTDLRDAVMALTAVLQRARAAPAAEPDREGAVASGGNSEPDLALELRRLLQELQAAP